MTIRQSGVTLRKGFIFKVLCVVLSCSIIIYAIHSYRKSHSLAILRRQQYYNLASFNRDEIMDFGGDSAPLFPNSYHLLSGRREEHEGSPVVAMEQKLIHLDLKGMAMKPTAFERLFPFLKKIGVTGIVIEYEDMFPYDGRRLKHIRNLEAYDRIDIDYILELAEMENLEVIPLVQTFGHLEFLLKLQDFAHLREAPRYPQVICPSNNHTLGIIFEMIDQMLKLHPKATRIHIGSDEVYYLGICPLCQAKMTSENSLPADIFLQHVKSVATYVKEKHKITPLMWDDEFRKLEEQQILNYGIGDIVEIVVWNYSPDVGSALLPNIWDKYGRIFKSVWIASAFKGANKPNSMIANESLYLTNHYSWMEVINTYKDKIQFKGIVVTGWQRYDHFAVLCELFPVGMPSLVSCMIYLNATGQRPSKAAILDSASTLLVCGSETQLCHFPGSQIYNKVYVWSKMLENWKKMKEQPIFLGWAQSINFIQRHSSPSHMDAALAEMKKFFQDAMKLSEEIQKELEIMFSKTSAKEWIMQNFNPIFTDPLFSNVQQMSSKTTFPVRPIKMN